MQPQEIRPPGWYPDPADSRQRRHWDGMRWGPVATPAGRPRRRLRWIWLAVVVAAIAGFCIVAPIVAVNSMLGPGSGELIAAANALAIPPELTLVDEHSTGNRLCMETCVTLSRRYSSPWPKEDTYRAFAAALTAAGYKCASYCTGFDDDGYSRTATWHRVGGLTMTVFVFSTADPGGSTWSQGARIDPVRQVHADLTVS